MICTLLNTTVNVFNFRKNGQKILKLGEYIFFFILLALKMYIFTFIAYLYMMTTGILPYN